MKRNPFILFVMAVVVLLVAFNLQPDPSVRVDDFESRIHGAFVHAGYRVVTAVSCETGDVPLPLWIEWQPRRWHREHRSATAFGYPNTAVCYTVTKGAGSKIDCYARYLDGRAVFINIHTPSAEKLSAATLRSSLSAEFPGLPIDLTVQ